MDFKSFKLLGFERGKGCEKYNAVLEDKKSNKNKYILHLVINDMNNIKIIYSHLGHNDIKRKNNYRTRHKHDKHSLLSRNT